MSKKATGTTKGKKRVTFSIETEKGKKISVAGSFNNWEADKKILKEKNGIYQVSMMLVAGTYEYKFCIDGEWCVDPKNPNFEANELGTLNSIIQVK